MYDTSFGTPISRGQGSSFSQVVPLLVVAAATHDYDSNISGLPRSGPHFHILCHVSPN